MINAFYIFIRLFNPMSLALWSIFSQILKLFDFDTYSNSYTYFKHSSMSSKSFLKFMLGKHLNSKHLSLFYQKKKNFQFFQLLETFFQSKKFSKIFFQYSKTLHFFALSPIRFLSVDVQKNNGAYEPSYCSAHITFLSTNTTRYGL